MRVTPRVTSPIGKPAPVWASLFMGPQVLQGPSSSVGFPCSDSLLQASPAPAWGLLAAGGSLHSHGPPWAVGAQLPHHGLHHSLQGNLSPGTWSTSSLFFSHLSKLQGCFSYLFPLLFPVPIAILVYFFTSLLLLTYVIPEMLPLLVTGLALASCRSVLELC